MAGESELCDVFFEIQKALAENDVQALERLYAEDYEGCSIYGELESLPLILETYKPGGVSGYSWRNLDLIAEVVEGAGLLTGAGEVSGLFGSEPFSHRLRFMEIYVRRDGRWQCYRSQSTEIREPATPAG